jgi:hypothetical protein
MQRVMYLRDQLRPVKNVSFDYSGALLAVSCTDGVVYVYSLSSEEPQLVKRVDGLISLLDSESEASAKVAWHPDGRAFGAPNALNGELKPPHMFKTRQADNHRFPNRGPKRLAFTEGLQRSQRKDHCIGMVSQRCSSGNCGSGQESHPLGNQDTEDLEEVGHVKS